MLFHFFFFHFCFPYSFPSCATYRFYLVDAEKKRNLAEQNFYCEFCFFFTETHILSVKRLKFQTFSHIENNILYVRFEMCVFFFSFFKKPKNCYYYFDFPICCRIRYDNRSLMLFECFDDNMPMLNLEQMDFFF